MTIKIDEFISKNISPFMSVDHTHTPQALVDYLDFVNAQDFMKIPKQKIINLLQIEPYHRILEIGCGAGNDALTLASFLNNTGQVIGIDKSNQMIVTAQQRIKQLNTHLPVTFEIADVETLSFADNYFDSCRSERVFQHLESPTKAIQEIARVTKPNGRIVIAEPDWETLTLDIDNINNVTRIILNNHCSFIKNGWIGRQLSRLFYDANLTQITVTPHTFTFTDFAIADQMLCFTQAAERAYLNQQISEKDKMDWLHLLQEAYEKNRFFSSLTWFIVSGVKQ